MADLNALIAQGAQFRAPPDPFAQYAQMQQLQQGMQANQLNQMKMDEYRQGVLADQRINQLDPSAPDYLRQVHGINAKKSFEFGKLQNEAETAKLTQQKARAELIDSKLKQSRQFLEGITTPEGYLAWVDANYRDPVLAPEFASRGATADKAKARVMQVLQQPGGLEQLIEESKVGVEKFAEINKPTFQSLAIPGVGLQTGTVRQGQFAPGALYKSSDVLSPEAEAQKARIAMAGRAPAAPRDDPSTTIANTQVDAAGNVTHYNKYGEPLGAPKLGAGKPSATYEKGVQQRKQLNLDLDATISELEKATAKGGLIEKATGSGAGALYDTAAGFFGSAPEGAIAVGALAPIYDKVLKMVPRFEGPQSDKDTASYKDAAGNLANPNTPKPIKMAAAKEILRLMKARKNQFGSKDMPEEATVTAPTNGWGKAVAK